MPVLYSLARRTSVSDSTYYRDRYANDPEYRARKLAEAKRWREKHPEKAREHQARHYAANREARIAAAAEYVRLHPRDKEQKRAYGQRRAEAMKERPERCSVDGCGRSLRNITLQLCQQHYIRLRRTGSVGGDVRVRRTVQPGATCSIDACGEPHEARGLCKPHYRALHFQENREQGRAWVRRRQMRKQALPSEVYTLTDIIVRDGTDCVLCGEPLELDARWPNLRCATVEHLECLSWPDSSGDVLANVAASHLTCNAARRDRPHPRAAVKRAELLRRHLRSSGWNQK